MITLLSLHYYRLADYFRTGGPLMLPLLLVSLVMWLLIVDRALFFRRLHRKAMANGRAWEHIRDNRMPGPDQGGAIGLLVARFLQQRSGDVQLDRSILDEIVLTLNRSLGNNLSFIGALAAIAPLLGLLGTVTGMMTTFDVLSFFGTGNAKGMAGGISEALITTETGLIVAIPGLYMKSFLDRRARSLRRRIAGAGYYLRRHLQENMPC